ncbi:MAG: hypothetical protein U9N61_11025, partial [Euryarchaeota archaeon]|nr:hypothetical protein [Euryarchaeota archaeon]
GTDATMSIKITTKATIVPISSLATISSLFLPFYNHKITQIFTNLFLKRKALPKELFCFFF